MFPLPLPDVIFDVRTFYAELVAFDSEELNAGMLDVSQKIQDLSRRLRAKEFKKRRLGRIIMKIQNMRLGVGCYSLVNKAKVPYGKKLEGKGNKPVSSTGHYRCEGSSETLFPNQIGTCVKVAGEKVLLSAQEMKVIKDQKVDDPSDNAVMHVIGFRDRSKLKTYHNIRTSYFIGADDEHVLNSSQVLDALIVTLLEKDQMAVVRLLGHSRGTGRLCVLLPQQEHFDEDHFQTPPGFHLIFLPYADDIRQPEIKIHREFKQSQAASQGDKDQLARAKLLVQALSQDQLDPRQFEDFQLQNFYSKLQAVALNEKSHQMQTVQDLLQPDTEGMRTHFSQILDLFHQAFPWKAEPVAPPKPYRQDKPVKKVQKEKESLESLIRQGKYSQMKVAELRVYMRTLGLPIDGLKDELVQRVLER